MIRLIIISLTFICILITNPALAGRYVVTSDSVSEVWASAEWSDYPTGFSGTACTWQTAMANAVAGDTVYFRAGTYSVHPCYAEGPYIPSIYPCNDGSDGSPITLINYPDELPIIHNPYTENLLWTNPCDTGCGVTTSQFTGGVLGAYNNSYVTISGFKTTATAYAGSVWITSSDHIIVENCEVVGNNIPPGYLGGDTGNYDGVRLYGTSYITVRNNIIRGMTLTGTDSGADHGACFKAWSSDHSDIYNNTIYDCDTAICDKDTGVDNDYHNNFIYDLDGSHGEVTGIRIGAMTADNWLRVSVYNNVIIMGDGVDAAIIFSDDSDFDPSYSYVYNNTIYSAVGETGLKTSYGSYPYKYFWNNIVYGFDDGLVIEGVGDYGLPDYSDYNNFYTSEQFRINRFAEGDTLYESLDAWDESGKLVGDGNPDTHSSNADPVLSNLGEANSADDFKLTAGSPASAKTGGRGGEYETYMGAWIWPLDSSQQIGYKALSVVLTGTLSDGATEAQIVTGGETLIGTIAEDTLVATFGADNAFTDAFIAALLSGGTETYGWNNVVVANLVYTDISRDSDTQFTVTLGAEATYAITTNETVTLTMPANCLTGGVQVVASPIFEITATSDPAAALTGTISDNATEAEIVTGGQTIIMTLTNDTWHADIGTDCQQTTDLKAGIDSAQSEGTGWDAVVKAGIEYDDFSRDSDTVVTLTLDAEATYDISANETITVTIPASALVTSASPVVATPTADIIFADTSTEEIVGITLQ